MAFESIDIVFYNFKKLRMSDIVRGDDNKNLVGYVFLCLTPTPILCIHIFHLENHFSIFLLLLSIIATLCPKTSRVSFYRTSDTQLPSFHHKNYALSVCISMTHLSYLFEQN